VSRSVTIPIFPLPGAILFPRSQLPLHIFEPRYRDMVRDAIDGPARIGMIQPLRLDEDNKAPLYEVGCLGEIVGIEELDDGRFNILLQARFRFRVLEEEEAGRPYRVARVEEIRSVPFPDPAAQARALSAASTLFAQLARDLELPPLPAETLSAERLASEIALRLRYSPQELQSILETDALPARFEAVTGRLFEWKARLNFLEPFRPSELDARRN